MGMENVIAKGPILQATDTIVNNRELRKDFLTALRDESQDYVDILEEFARKAEVPCNRFQMAYLRLNWFPAPPDPSEVEDVVRAFEGSWWRDFQPIEPIVRHGLIKAIQEATPRDLDLDSYWLCPAASDFEVIVSRSEKQVTRIIMTPPVPVHIPTPSIKPEGVPIWIIKRTNKIMDELKDTSKVPGLGRHIVSEQIDTLHP